MVEGYIEASSNLSIPQSRQAVPAPFRQGGRFNHLYKPRFASYSLLWFAQILLTFRRVWSHTAVFGPSTALTVHRTVIHYRLARLRYVLYRPFLYLIIKQKIVHSLLKKYCIFSRYIVSLHWYIYFPLCRLGDNGKAYTYGGRTEICNESRRKET